MWMRSEHAELALPALWDFIRQNPLGMLITALPSSEAVLDSVSSRSPEIQVTHIPWVLDIDPSSSDTDSFPSSSSSSSTTTTNTTTSKGRLRGHMARQNPQAKALVLAAGIHSMTHPESVQVHGTSVVLEHEVSVVFNGAAHAYVPTQFYVATKPATGKTAPTWNYSAVQAWGRLRIWADAAAPDTDAYLQRQLEDLSRHAEEGIMGHVRRGNKTDGDGKTAAWEVSDAPEPFVRLLKKAIVGVEIDITRLEGKFKMSQELSNAGDRQGVVDGFNRLGDDNAREIARLVREHGGKRDAELAEKKAMKAAVAVRRSQSHV